MPRVGYARVSTIDQDLDLQLAKLKAEGCEVIRSEKVSGGSRDGRTELATVLAFLRPGDELVVTRLDRLGRDTRDVLNLIHECEQKGRLCDRPRPARLHPGRNGPYRADRARHGRSDGAPVHQGTPADGIERAKSDGVYHGGKRRLDRSDQSDAGKGSGAAQSRRRWGARACRCIVF